MGLFDKLIFKQVKRRELVLQQEGPGVEALARKIKLRPFITISRESGSGGTPIAKLVAKKLRFKFYNKKLIDMIAKQTKKRKVLIESLDEKDRGMVEDIVQSFFNPDYVAGETYFKHLCRVTMTLAKRGNCVILGRGANFITSDYGGLHVRIVAPFLVRAGYTAQYEGYTIYEARERMQKFDKERKDFIKEYFGKDPSNANYYDLVINTEGLKPEAAAEVILTAFKKKFPDWQKYR
ncbi:cytidylate kinase-like family protein [Patescibacteria group bacterium]|nr:cytidylate kinase-like family protein [Patescibacteria group bacterium]